LNDGSQWGITLQYAIQPEPKGLAQAFIIGEDFIKSDPVCLILGDNIFFGHRLPEQIQRASKRTKGATIFGYYVRNPQRYGVVNFDEEGKVIDIEEKPAQPKSNYAVTGLYFYDNDVVKIAKNIKPSKRGELEITDVNKTYLNRGDLHIELIGRGAAWLDTGTHESLLDAANFIKVVEDRQGLKIACLEEISYRLGYITAAQVQAIAEPLAKNNYGQYLLHLIEAENWK
jgi:glucose-1-phosphate thymidylyltransferase